MTESTNLAAQASDEPMRKAWFAFFAEHGAQYGDHKAAQDAFTAGYRAATPSATADVERDDIVDDMAMLIRKLVRAVRNMNPNSELAAGAVGYLQRKGLTGSPLRATKPGETT